MNTKHWKVVENLKQEYRDRGYFVDTEVSCPHKDSFFVVDLVAIKGKEKIAIEVGVCTEEKFEFLKTNFTDVILKPYLTISKEGYFYHNLCGYRWKPRKEYPKECPKCKGRLDSARLDRVAK